MSPRPTPTEMTVTIKRSIWTEAPKGTYEVAASMTCEVDRNFPASANLDALHKLVSARVYAYLDEATGASAPPAKSA